MNNSSKNNVSGVLGVMAGIATLSLLLSGCVAGTDETKIVVDEVAYTAETPLTASAAGACVANGKADDAQSIAYVPPTTSFNYYLAIGKGIESRAAGAGAEYFMLAPAKDDVSVQIGMLQDAATRGVDAIIMNTHDQAAAAPVVKAAADKGIAIILVNSDIPDFPTPVQAVVGYKQRSGDQKVGEYAVKAAAGADVMYGVIEGAPSYFSDERVGGWEQGVESASNFTKVASINGEWGIDGGNRAALDLVQAHPEINVIFAANDYMAQGAVQALKALSRDDIVVYGSDGDTNSGLEEVAAGTIKATLNTSPFAMGQIAMQVALDCLSGAFAGGAFVESPGTVVDETGVLAILCKPELLYPAPNKEYNCS
jgi:ribose transport system substrate-binding protein